MARSYGMFRAKCGHEGCTEFARYEAGTRKHYLDLSLRYGNGKWRCVRHSQPDEVLSSTNTKLVNELRVIVDDGHSYWGKERASSGFKHGPGFKAFAEDFPEGTVLRITAEIVPAPSRNALDKERG
ncbi:hypothetical protein GR158_12040 [Shinella sp. AETb1-6]|uniref:hypothetical protein n=1 Tax=Shinella sp. AETb1-6 TaxID=2692210 RepID=UPI00136EABF2|nr:hypothetical protein [Shinella sp. AETb1-6]MXN51852.1 hypothetical protein [Shinella sp. AETb1-6]